MLYPGLEILAETTVAEAKVTTQFPLSPSTTVYSDIIIGVLCPRDVFRELFLEMFSRVEKVASWASVYHSEQSSWC